MITDARIQPAIDYVIERISDHEALRKEHGATHAAVLSDAAYINGLKEALSLVTGKPWDELVGGDHNG